MSAANRYCNAERELDTLCVFSHFDQEVDSNELVATLTDSGTAAVGDEAGGVITLTPSDGSVADNDEAYISLPNEVFLFATGKPLSKRARVKFTEVAAGVANVAFGGMNAAVADSILDNGAGLKVSGSAIGVYKVDGEQVWRFVTANNSASTVTKSNKAATAGVWYDLELLAVDNGDGTLACTAKVDGESLRDSNNQVIRHSVSVGSATEMTMFAGIKLGAATNNDTLKVDFWLGKQKVF